MGKNAGYFNKANQLFSFFLLFSFKKIASKIDKHVMLSYLLLFNKRLEFAFFKLHPKFPRARAKQTRWKFAAFAYYTEENQLPQITVLN